MTDKIDHADYGNGTRSLYGYDGRGTIYLVQHTRGDGANLSWRSYWRDERDRITAYQKSADNSVNPMEDGRGDFYDYDAEGQLTRARYGVPDPGTSGDGYQWDENFGGWDNNSNWRGYDALGNRRGWNLQTSSGNWTWYTRKDNGLNEYRSWSPSIINYDEDINGWGSPRHANGVIMQEGTFTGGYNALNQPMLMTSNALSPNWMFFGYDPLGRCVKRWRGGLTPEGI